MSLEEMELEFKFKFDAASNGGPDLNTYEISLCLTQAARDIILSSYSSYETNEISKRIISPFLYIKKFNSELNNLNESIDIYSNLITYNLDYSDVKFLYRIRDRVKLKNCISTPKVDVIKKDNLQEFLNNPFKKPNIRKVLREDINGTSVKIFTSIPIEQYEIEFVKKDKPIIIKNFSEDPTLMGDETIEGMNTASMSYIPDIYHDKIIARAVQLAILYTRENGLNNQISVQ